MGGRYRLLVPDLLLPQRTGQWSPTNLSIKISLFLYIFLAGSLNFGGPFVIYIRKEQIKERTMEAFMNGMMIACLIGIGTCILLGGVCWIGEKIIKMIGEDRFINFMYGGNDDEAFIDDEDFD